MYLQEMHVCLYIVYARNCHSHSHAVLLYDACRGTCRSSCDRSNPQKLDQSHRLHIFVSTLFVMFCDTYTSTNQLDCKPHQEA